MMRKSESQVRALGRSESVDRPVLVVGAPRSGTSMLFQALSTHPSLWSLYRESQHILEKFMASALELHDSDQLDAADCSADSARRLSRLFCDSVGNAEAGGGWRSHLPLILRARLSGLLTSGRVSRPPSIRIVEKNPQNSFRLRFLDRLFVDAKILYITRAPTSNIASIYRGWSEPRFRTQPLPSGYAIRGYRGSSWCFGRPPGWRNLSGQSLIDVCAFQWRAYNEACLSDARIFGDRVLRVKYEDLCVRPGLILREVAEWAELDGAPFEKFATGLPVVNTWSRPREDKWRSVSAEVEKVTASIGDVAAALGYYSVADSR